jgi:hypothetical protein
MYSRCFHLVALAWLAWALPPVSAQSRAATDAELDRTAGTWVANGVFFGSSQAVHPFSVDVKRDRSQLRVTVPTELKLPAGQVYLLDRAGAGTFRHVDGSGRIVELSVASPTRASLLITGTGGDGRITTQLTRR